MNEMHKEGESKDGLYKLTKEQCKQLIEKGYTHAMVNGGIRKVSIDDLIFKKDEVDEYINKKLKEKQQ